MSSHVPAPRAFQVHAPLLPATLPRSGRCPAFVQRQQSSPALHRCKRRPTSARATVVAAGNERPTPRNTYWMQPPAGMYTPHHARTQRIPKLRERCVRERCARDVVRKMCTMVREVWYKSGPLDSRKQEKDVRMMQTTNRVVHSTFHVIALDRATLRDVWCRAVYYGGVFVAAIPPRYVDDLFVPQRCRRCGVRWSCDSPVCLLIIWSSTVMPRVQSVSLHTNVHARGKKRRFKQKATSNAVGNVGKGVRQRD